MKKAVILKILEDTKFSVSEDIDLILDLREVNKPVRLDLIFDKPGVDCHLIGMYVVRDGQEMDLQTIAHHQTHNTSCLQDVRAILFDGGVSKYLGSIKIEENAYQTSSFLENSVLVLGDNIKNISEPVLEIKNNDVKASHGSTTGRIDEEKIFYLKSRGLNQEESENLVIQGFFERLISQIEDEKAQEELREILLGELNR